MSTMKRGQAAGNRRNRLNANRPQLVKTAMKLHPIKHDLKTTLWCGPAALAAITGKPTSEVMATAKRVMNRRTVKGMSNLYLSRVARALGVELETKYLSPGLTLARWCKTHKHLFADKPVIVNVTGHYVTVCGRTFVDNHVERAVPLKRAPHRRCRVQVVFVASPITPAAPFPFPDNSGPELAKYVKPFSPVPSERTEARRIARRFDIEIQMEEFSEPGEFQQPRFVYAPELLDSEELDPHAGDHVVNDWKEALDRVKQYARLATVIPCFAEQ